MHNRRALLLGLGSLVCAPAIVRASSLMPVRAWRPILSIDVGADLGTAIGVYGRPPHVEVMQFLAQANRLMSEMVWRSAPDTYPVGQTIARWTCP